MVLLHLSWSKIKSHIFTTKRCSKATVFKSQSFYKPFILSSDSGLSYRDIEELLGIRGVKVDQATIQRWVFKFSPLLEREFNKGKKACGKSWRIDETYIKVKGQWHYL
ncbi:MAG TPA: DDE-type integrase/transposase/recombinase [Yeosuana sp.]